MRGRQKAEAVAYFAQLRLDPLSCSRRSTEKCIEENSVRSTMLFFFKMKQNKYHEITNMQFKEICRARKLKVSGKKADLIKRSNSIIFQEVEIVSTLILQPRFQHQDAI